MKNEFNYPYQEEVQNVILERFLPPYYVGGVNPWLNSLCNPGDSIFDPFGSHPLLALDAAQEGYTVFVNSHNPILQLALEVFASAPTQKDFNRALAAFSTIKRGDEFLEQHLMSLFNTKCPLCGEIVPATAFIWIKDAPLPARKIINCPKCHQSGEFDIDAYDIHVLEKIGSAKLHQSRALSSVSDPQNPLLPEIESMLEIFPLRSLYTILNMTNRIKGNFQDEKNQLLLLALLLNFCDTCNALWDPENKRFRPKQLIVPSVYKEMNPWLLIPTWIESWSRYKTPIPVTTWPAISTQPGGSICLLPFRLKESVTLMKTRPIKAVIGIIPRPSNAFWSLSAFWSGWLFGLAAVKNMAFAFNRKRYDWNWQADALSASFEWINQSMEEQTPILLNTPELTPGFVSSLFAASHNAEWSAQAMAMNADQQNLYSVWRRRNTHYPQISVFESQSELKKSLLEVLKEINEPLEYLSLHTLFCSHFIRHMIPDDERSFQRIKNGINQVFKSSPLFYRTRGNNKEKESGFWWIKSNMDFNHRLTYSERLEAFTYHQIQQQGWLNENTFIQQAASQFPGLNSPSLELLKDCLQAYAIYEANGIWKLAEMDHPQQRNQVISEIQEDLTRLGENFQFNVATENKKIIWKKDALQVTFNLLNCGICSPFFPKASEPEKYQTVIIFPGSKSKLIHHRLEIDPRYHMPCSLVKFRHILQVMETVPPDFEQFLSLLKNDEPAMEDMRQMSLF
jgi:hypothetical protein